MPSTEPLITVQDMRNGTMEPFPDTDTEEQQQLLFLIRFASGKARRGVIRASGLDLDDGIANGTVDRDLVMGIMVVAVHRAIKLWRRGFGVRNKQYLEESTEYSDGDAGSSSLVYFTAEEIDDLTPNRPSGSSREAFTITPGPR
ncbi:hypothetical protein CH255_19780 [Rhodococcus sp. 05-2255-2A2]|uniref:hypothetical protein n=1 Tax=unclassified Rhodococcus (in: high G+C Gram-positive bacteria) TaxID=192944 RepID=UPI000B9B77BC|nr:MULTISPECIES: hypothetical protein [unclassified Rhodococcus (in: high G+C Gram-positive bacteria)]OZE03890.1 hypothetical protein CH250_22630 [Rhodococcus sp. 05-2255-3C]OZE17043.1 hypothetical protein CH255_19780 [Rhodococcus sp. 05-2255-2A2]